MKDRENNFWGRFCGILWSKEKTKFRGLTSLGWCLSAVSWSTQTVDGDHGFRSSRLSAACWCCHHTGARTALVGGVPLGKAPATAWWSLQKTCGQNFELEMFLSSASCRSVRIGRCVRLTFGLQVEILIWVRLRVVHELPHDDGKAVDVTFRRSVDRDADLSQKLGSCPVQLYSTARQKQQSSSNLITCVTSPSCWDEHEYTYI